MVNYTITLNANNILCYFLDTFCVFVTAVEKIKNRNLNLLFAQDPIDIVYNCFIT